MICQLVAKTFELANLSGDEIGAIAGVTLANAILENVKGVNNLVSGLIEAYLQQMQTVTTPDLQLMLLQGILMCIWYDAQTTFAKLESSGASTHVMT